MILFHYCSILPGGIINKTTKVTIMLKQFKVNGGSIKTASLCSSLSLHVQLKFYRHHELGWKLSPSTATPELQSLDGVFADQLQVQD